jgi:hypothetical protein
MDIITQIRNEVREKYFAKLLPLTHDLLNDTAWKSLDIDIKKKTLLAIQEGRLSRAKYEEISELKKRGYIVIRGLTLQEWQKYFCDILEKHDVHNIKRDITNKKHLLDDLILKNIFTKEQYNKLVTVTACSHNIFALKFEHLFDRMYNFPPFQ